MRRSLPARTLCLALVVGITAACAGDASRAPTAQEMPVRGGRIIEGGADVIDSLNWAVSKVAGAGLFHALIYEPLLELDAFTAEPLPRLGRAWTVSSDGLEYRWEIEPAATWSDGVPVTAADWLTTARAIARSKISPKKNNLQRVVGFADYSAGRASSISGIEADGKRLTVRLASGFCQSLIQLFYNVGPLPTHVFGKYLSDTDPSRNLDSAPENMAPPVSSGPFVFKEYRKGEHLVLSRNERYWRGAPLVDEYVWKIVEPAAYADQVRSGGVNYLAIDDNVRLAAELRSERTLTLHSYAGPFMTYLGWNLRSPGALGLQDRRIRQALAYGLDLKLVIDRIWSGEATRMYAHHAPMSWAYPAGLSEYPYDKSRAEELIRAAGYTKGGDGVYAKAGQPLAFTMSAYAERERELDRALLQLAIDQYREIGIRVTAQLQTAPELERRFAAGDPELHSWIDFWNINRPDPNGLTELWESRNIPGAGGTNTNVGGFRDPRVDQAILDGRFGPDCSRPARQRAYATLNRILNEEQPYNFGVRPNAYLVTSSTLRGTPAFGAQGSYYLGIEKWWFASRAP